LAIFLNRRMIHVAEPAGESNQIRIRNVLISKYEPRMTGSRLGPERDASLQRHNADAARPVRENGGTHQPGASFCVLRRLFP
jgi:hypothetical protein